MEVSWKWDPENGGSVQTIRVRLERRPGQSIRNWANDFREAVEAMMELYPPNEGPTVGLTSNGGGPTMGMPTASGTLAIETGVTLEVSWKHDPDKEGNSNGPLEPVTVTAKVEKRDGESSREAARRLGQVVEALQEAFPPNVPEAQGG